MDEQPIQDISDDAFAYHLGRFYSAGGSLELYMETINATRLRGEVYELSPRSKRRLYQVFCNGYADAVQTK